MTQNQSPENRRKHPRIEHNVPLKISCESGDVVTETKNVSCAGAYCKVDKYLEPMTKLQIQLLLPVKRNNKISTKKIQCHGVVVRTQTRENEDLFDTAIFFNDISPKDSRVIADFVELLLEQKKNEATSSD